MQQHNQSDVKLYQQHDLPLIIPAEPPTVFIVNRLYERSSIADNIGREIAAVDMHYLSSCVEYQLKDLD